MKNKTAYRQARTKSVYPDALTQAILVGSTQSYNLALRLFAEQLDEASRRLLMFESEEWETIAGAVKVVDFATISNPLGAIRQLVEKPALRTDKSQRIIDGLQSYEDPMTGWAIVWACRFHEAHPDVSEWWKIEKRLPK
jgi:hypothetical protein